MSRVPGQLEKVLDAKVTGRGNKLNIGETKIRKI